MKILRNYLQEIIVMFVHICQSNIFLCTFSWSMFASSQFTILPQLVCLSSFAHNSNIQYWFMLCDYNALRNTITLSTLAIFSGKVYMTRWTNKTGILIPVFRASNDNDNTFRNAIMLNGTVANKSPE